MHLSYFESKPYVLHELFPFNMGKWPHFMQSSKLKTAYIFWVPIKCETKQKRSETKRNEINKNETKRNETKRNQQKRNETKRNQRNENEIKRNQRKQNEINENKTKQKMEEKIIGA